MKNIMQAYKLKRKNWSI